MLFQPGSDLGELLVNGGHLFSQLGDLFGVADTGYHVFALGVQQVIAVHQVLAGRGIAGEGHAGAAFPAHVAENHGLDVDGCSQVVADAGRVAVVHRTLAVPAPENRFSRQPQLLVGILRELHAGLFSHDNLELLGQFLPVRGIELGVRLDALLRALFSDQILEWLVVDVQHDAAKHLHQTAIAVVDEALVAGQRDHARGGLVVQTDVQHGVHHAGHGELGARPAGDQQRLLRIAKDLARCCLGGLHGRQFLLPHALGELVTASQIGVACLGRDGETGRDRNADAGHLGQIGALAAQQRTNTIPTAAHIIFCFVYIFK